MLRLGQSRQGPEHLQFAGAQQRGLALPGRAQQVPTVRQPQVQPGQEMASQWRQGGMFGER